MSDRPLRVALWCAVSSKAQVGADKVSLPEQRRAGEEFAAALGGHVSAVYEVPGHSRDIIFYEEAAQQMDAYRRLREDVEAHRLDVLHVVDPDRLARDPALSQTAISMCEKNGCEVYFASSPHVVGQKGQGARYVEAFMAVRASEEQTIRVARHERGMRGRVRRGLHAGTWPYGYEPVRDARGHTAGAEVIPEEAATIRHATRLFLAGTSYREIARALNDAGFPTRDATEWYPSKVRRLMFNDTYAGYPRWRKARPDEMSTRYPHLWDVSTYAAIVTERRRRGSRQHHATPLMDVAFCGRCGGRMTRIAFDSGNRRYMYLRCGQHAQDGSCRANHVPEEDVRRAVVAYLAERLGDAGEVERLAVSQAGPRADLERERDDLNARAGDIAERRQRIALALAAGQLDPMMYRQVDDALLDDLDGVNAAAAALEAQLEALPSPEQQVLTMTRLLETLDDLWDRPPREVAALLQAAGVVVFCRDGEVSALHIGL